MRINFIKTIKFGLLNLKVYQRFSQFRNLYETLGLSQQASFKQIKQKYLQKSKQLHPDRSSSNLELYHKVQAAYKTLSTPQSRKNYDLSLGIINSVWEREFNSKEFSKDFQSELFDQILKHDKIRVQSDATSLQQSLQAEFSKEIQNFKLKHWVLSWSFGATFCGFGLLWSLWNLAEFLILNHEGDQKHQIQFSNTDSSLKIVPLVTR